MIRCVVFVVSLTCAWAPAAAQLKGPVASTNDRLSLEEARSSFAAIVSCPLEQVTARYVGTKLTRAVGCGQAIDFLGRAGLRMHHLKWTAADEAAIDGGSL